MNNVFQITTTHRIHQIEKRLDSLEASIALLGQRALSLDKAVDRLVKSKDVKLEITERPVIEVSKDLLKARKCRKKDIVAERWGVWEKLDRAGVRCTEIAKAFKCNHGSVLFAKRQGFKSGWLSKAERRGLEA